MSLNSRREILRKILSQNTISSQDEIAEALLVAGVSVTQTTVSRDLAAIGAVRGQDGYRLGGSFTENGHALPIAGNDELSGLIYRHVLSVAKAQAIVVVKTAPGHAQMLASAFDRWPPYGVVGTVAGDDTIFLATTSSKAIGVLMKTLRAAMEGGRL